MGGLGEGRAVVVEAGDAVGERLGVGVGGEEAVEGVADGVLTGRGAESDDGQGGGHGIKEGAAEVVGEMRHEEEVAVGEGLAEGGGGGERAGKGDGETKALGEGAEGGELRAVAVEGGIDGDGAGLQDGDRAEEEVEAFEGLHAGGGDKAQGGSGGGAEKAQVETLEREDVFAFVDRLADGDGVGGEHSITGDCGWGVEEGEGGRGDAVADGKILAVEGALTALALNAVGGGADPLPLEHVAEVFGDDEEGLLVLADGVVVGEVEVGIGLEEVGGVDEVGLIDGAAEDGSETDAAGEADAADAGRERDEGDAVLGVEDGHAGSPGLKGGELHLGRGDGDGADGVDEALEVFSPEAVEDELAAGLLGVGDVGDEEIAHGYTWGPWGADVDLSMGRAGIPTTVMPAGTSWVTTALAPMVA